MPSETVEITFIFFILFIISLSIVNIFLSLQENTSSSLNKLFLQLIRNSVFLAYTTSLVVENSTIAMDLSKLPNIRIAGSYSELTIYVANDVTTIAVNNTKGIGFDLVYFYNKNGTIYIL